MKLFDAVTAKIDTGILGLNKGLPMGFNRMVEYVPGIQQGTYYLVGAETSVGKTAFVDNCFVYNPVDWVINNQDKTDIKIKVIYYSLEITKEIKITKAICRKIFIDTGQLLDVNYILSRGKNRISQQDYEIVMGYKEYFYKLEDHITIIDKNDNPTGIWHNALDYSKQNGSWDTVDFQGVYTPKNSNLYTILVVDTVNLVKKERGFDVKSNIDKLSEYLVILRNKCNYIPVIISQFNRTISSSDRFKIERVEPQLSDFKSSSNTQDDANIVFGLFNPKRYDLETYKGYDIKKLKHRFRGLHLLKNRDGESDKFIGLDFIGQVGHFSELPTPTEFEQNITLYNKYK